MIVLGLTGSIGMGKSTTARLFEEAGVPVWDADAAVHRLYGPDGAGTAAIRALAPDAVGPEGVDRARLRAAAMADPDLLRRIEAAIHPLVAQDRARFLEVQRGREVDIVLLDIPLLFETGNMDAVDRVVVVSAPPEVQRERVLAREGMTPEHFETILARQVPDAEKRAQADFVIDTGAGIEAARRAVTRIVDELRGRV